jgi:hypothetical protein
MALMQCTECNQEISSLSDHCVHCGYPIVNLNRALDDFREKRLRVIDEGGMFDISGPKVVFHIVPRESLFIEKAYGVVGISAYISKSIHLLFGGSVEPAFSGNGILLLQRNYDNNKPVSCLEINRNGIVEAVDSLFFGVDKSVGYFLMDLFMDRLVTSCNEILMLYKLVGVEPPFTLMVSFSGIKDYTVSTKSVHFPGKRAHHDIALLQKVDFNTTDAVQKSDLRPFFEQVWNCFNYMRVRNIGKQIGISAFAKG